MHKPANPPGGFNQLSPNRQAPWPDFDAEAYNLNHYKVPSDADQQVLCRIADALVASGVSADSYLELGNAGSMRLATVAGFVLSSDARRLLTDVGPRQLGEARRVINAVNAALAGEATKEQLELYRQWRQHEDALVFGDEELETHAHPQYVGALGRACQHATVEELWAQDLQPDQADVIGEGHFLCSGTPDRKEAKDLTAAVYKGAGRLIIRMFDIGSSWYEVGLGENKRKYPGLPITPESVSEEAEGHGLIVVDCFGIEIKNYNATATAGSKATRSTLKGLGGAVLMRPQTRTVIDLAPTPG